ncbi:MAG TPA: hypothetical protein PLZ51_27145, partial [Aggregatilineales bacterium]|nr:hypothetical protein [Aggregatilineales bacterium]
NVGKNDYIDEGALWASLGALTLLLMLLLIWNRPSTLPPVNIPSTDKTFTRTRWIFVVIGILALAILAEINGKMFKIHDLMIVSSHIQFALWVVGIAFLTYGFAGWRYTWAEKQLTPDKTKR